MLKKSKLIEAIRSKSESTEIDFKINFDNSSTQDWCELIKDLVAISNSGGGGIIFGVDDYGEIFGSDLDDIFDIDPAVITDKVYKYTGVQVAGFKIEKLQFQSDTLPELRTYNLPVLHIPGSDFPIPFNKAGNYGIIGGKQKTAFSKGTIYFRHGAKSEPCNYNDIRAFYDEKLEITRKSWFKNINKVMEAPPGSKIRVLSSKVIETKDKDATKIRLTDDEDAAVYKKLDPDTTHPFRQTEIVKIVNDKLGDLHKINSYDIQSIKQVHDITKESRFHHKPKFGGSQYSEEFANWIVQKFDNNPRFFEEARQAMYDLRYGDNNKN